MDLVAVDVEAPEAEAAGAAAVVAEDSERILMVSGLSVSKILGNSANAVRQRAARPRKQLWQKRHLPTTIPRRIEQRCEYGVQRMGMASVRGCKTQDMKPSAEAAFTGMRQEISPCAMLA